MVQLDDLSSLITPGPTHHDSAPSTDGAGYHAWVDHRQLDRAALDRRRDQRRLSRALRRARKLRVRTERAWARVRQVESSVAGPVC